MKRFITGLLLCWICAVGCQGMDIHTNVKPHMGCGCCQPAPAPAPAPEPKPEPEPTPKPKPHPFRPFKADE